MWSIQLAGHIEGLYSNNLESGKLATLFWNNPTCDLGLSKLKVHNKSPNWVTGILAVLTGKLHGTKLIFGILVIWVITWHSRRDAK